MPWQVLAYVGTFLNLSFEQSLLSYAASRCNQAKYIFEKFWIIWRAEVKFQAPFENINLFKLLNNQL